MEVLWLIIRRDQLPREQRTTKLSIGSTTLLSGSSRNVLFHIHSILLPYNSLQAPVHLTRNFFDRSPAAVCYPFLPVICYGCVASSVEIPTQIKIPNQINLEACRTSLVHSRPRDSENNFKSQSVQKTECARKDGKEKRSPRILPLPYSSCCALVRSSYSCIRSRSHVSFTLNPQFLIKPCTEAVHNQAIRIIFRVNAITCSQYSRNILGLLAKIPTISYTALSSYIKRFCNQYRGRQKRFLAMSSSEKTKIFSSSPHKIFIQALYDVLSQSVSRIQNGLKKPGRNQNR